MPALPLHELGIVKLFGLMAHAADVVRQRDFSRSNWATIDMTVTVHQLRAGGTLAHLADAITSALSRCEREVFPALDLPDVDLVVGPGPRVIPEFGLAGLSTGANQAFIELNPESPNLARDFQVNFVATVGHELHHCSRSGKGKLGRTLWDLLVSEGLACHYESELRGSPPFYATFLSDAEKEALRPRLKAEEGREDFNYFAWFYGSKEQDLPKYAGYSIGYSIVNRYVEATGIPASQLADVDAEEFR